MSFGQFTTRCALATVLFGLVPSDAQAQETISIDEIRALKARIKQLEDRVSRQDQTVARHDRQQKVITTQTKSLQDRIKRVAYGPPTTSTSTGPVGIDIGRGSLPTFSRGPGKGSVQTGPSGTSTSTTAPVHWYDRLSLRGYTQGRFTSFVNGDREMYRLPGDRGVGKDQNFSLRRVRLILSGDVSEHLFLYIQPDFANTPTGSSTGNYGQLRDAYGDIFFDAKKEFRVRAGQSKIPFSFENMQSSQNRLSLDRNDATNTCCRDERDVGLFFYYTPEHLRPVFRDLVKNNLKGSGDYGLFALGVYNGQGANRVELNNEVHVVSRVTYPYTFANGQIVEAGAQGIVGRFIPSTGAIGSVTPTLQADRKGIRDQRVGVHAILYPQPFGIQAEWNWGAGPGLNEPQTMISARSLTGGYIQASYKYEDRAFLTGTYFPFVKYQHFRGASKFETNAPMNEIDDYEFGVEWQPRPELEFTAVYAKLHRTNLFVAPYDKFRADVIRTQLQWNY